MPGPCRGGCCFSGRCFRLVPPVTGDQKLDLWGPHGSHPSLSPTATCWLLGPPAWQREGGFAIYLVKYHPLASPPAPSTGDRWGVAHWPTLSAHSCPAGAKGIVNSSLIPSLVWKLQREEERIQELLLDTLAACLMEDATEALASGAVPFLKEKLLSANSNIRSKAAQALTAIR